MTERIGLSLVLLLIAMAQLATDVARLALEASSRPSINEPAPAPAQPGVQEMPRPPPSREQPEQPSDPIDSWAFDPPRAMPTKRTPANRMINRLPLDFSINSHPGAWHAGIAIRADIRGGTGISGNTSAHTRHSLTSKRQHR
jgi:hypothetical protein